MKKNPIISIIIPVYNAEKYLEKCLDSITRQTYSELEIILINDGSIDSSPEICERWRKKDSRIVVLHIENSGPQKARNIGIEYSHGEYIAFCDADDEVSSKCYELLIYYANKEKVKIVACNYCISKQLVEHDTNSFDIMIFNGKDDIYENIKCLQGYIWNKLYLSDIVKSNKFRDDIVVGEDALFSFKLFDIVDRIAYIDIPLYFYRKHNTSITCERTSEAWYKDCCNYGKIIQENQYNNKYIKKYLLDMYIMSNFKAADSAVKHSSIKKCRDLLDEIKHNLEEYKIIIYRKRSYKIKYRILCFSKKIYKLLFILN